jgi:hypothetical protein
MRPTQHNRILLFTRYPEAGRCKTRLIPVLGAGGAAALHRKMTQRMIGQVTRLAAIQPHLLEIHHDGGTQTQMRSWLGVDHHYHKQGEGDIGCRMQTAILRHLGRRQRLLLIGSDCPGLSAEIMQEAFTALTSHDLVLGPAYDGGYYLIGLGAEISAPTCHSLFQDIPWSTDGVYTTTKKRAEEQRLRCHTLTRLHDIDTPADLRYLDHHPYPQ